MRGGGRIECGGGNGGSRKVVRTGAKKGERKEFMNVYTVSNRLVRGPTAEGFGA